MRDRLPLGSLVLWLACVALVACGEPLPPGYEGDDFESAGWAGSSPMGSPGSGADAGAAAPGPDGAEDLGAPREVEEADLYRVAGDRLYVLNQYRGLYVFDLTDPDHPRELGRMPLSGHPVEMYIRGDRAYAILSDYFTYWYDETRPRDAGLSPYFGSRIVAIDLSDPSAPEELGDVLLDGYVADTRLVGDVIYAVANRYAWWSHWGVSPSETRDQTVLTSIDIADPARITQVAQLTLEGNGWFVHATSDAFILAGNDSSPGSWESQTEVRYFDISDPRGAIAARGALRLGGWMRDDTALHVHEGQLRVLTRSSNGVTTHVRIFDATQPDTLPMLGQLDYDYEGSVFGTTFDGDRLYMIHYMTIDPLEVVDLSDPTAPYIAGILEMPGWVERIAARGDRLVGLGVDDTDGTQRTSLTLFDVSDPSDPQLLARENVDAEWSWSAATWERKAWTVDWREGLALFPYSGYSTTPDGWGGYHHALSIVEVGRDSLTRRGTVESPSPVERGFFHAGRVYSLSLTTLQVVDVRDRARPVATGTVELARNLADYTRTARAGVELIRPIEYYDQGGTTLRTTPLGAPDGSAELGRVTLDRAADRVLAHGDLVLAVGTGRWGWSDATTGAGVAVVDVRDAAAPRVVADLALPDVAPLDRYARDGYAYRHASWRASYGAPYGTESAGAPLLDLGGGRFAIVRTVGTSCGGYGDSVRELCRSLEIEPRGHTERYDYGYGYGYGETYYHGTRFDNDLFVIDVSDPARPLVRGPFSIGEGRVEQPFVSDGALVLSHALPSRVDETGRTWVRWFYERWTLAEDGTPRRASAINVPGIVLSVRADGLVTLDQQWARDGGEARNTLNGVTVAADRATRRSHVELGDGWLPALAVRGDRAYGLRVRQDYGADYWRTAATIEGVDLSDLAALRVTRSTPVGDGAWAILGLSDRTLAISGGWGGGVGLFDLSDDGGVRFRRYVRSFGWGTQIHQTEGTMYLAGGPYGLTTIRLDE
ncbi:MAG: beta-propeller domain-containing protein [Sandaracinaceae bacterium]|nr:beta-propeller domain-containing protein [Sandaracinaceae bacterium]